MNNSLHTSAQQAAVFELESRSTVEAFRNVTIEIVRDPYVSVIDLPPSYEKRLRKDEYGSVERDTRADGDEVTP